MADIGLVASIVQTVGTGTQLSIAIFDVAATIGNAEKDLQHIGTEVSLPCSVLKPVQALLEHAHFRPSTIAIESAQKIVQQCRAVFEEMTNILAPLKLTGSNAVFPAADLDFISKVKWAFSKRSRISMLRSTLESCKLTLSVMLNTMQLAERVSQRRASTIGTMQEDEHDKAMTQSLLISQQYAVEQLEHWENEVEKEEELARMLVPAIHNPDPRMKKRRRSRGRLVEMFSGLRVETELPRQYAQQQQPVLHRERPSVWLESILAPPPQPGEIHPGRLKQKRLSSVGTTNAPMELLKKWTDQGGDLNQRQRTMPLHEVVEVDQELWRDSKFSFQVTSPPASPDASTVVLAANRKKSLATTSQASSEFISPKTARVNSVGFHLIAGVDGTLEKTHDAATTESDDSYEAIAKSILEEHGASVCVNEIALCISYGGRTRVLKKAEKPLDALRHYSDLELEPRLFIRRAQS